MAKSVRGYFCDVCVPGWGGEPGGDGEWGALVMVRAGGGVESGVFSL